MTNQRTYFCIAQSARVNNRRNSFISFIGWNKIDYRGCRTSCFSSGRCTCQLKVFDFLLMIKGTMD